MKKSKFYFGIYLVVIFALLSFFGIHKYRSITNNPSRAIDNNQSATATDKLIAKYLTQLQANPDNTKVELELAGAYIQKARETGDVSLFNKVDGLMDKVQTAEPSNADVYGTRGIVALARHHFCLTQLVHQQLSRKTELCLGSKK